MTGRDLVLLLLAVALAGVEPPAPWVEGMLIGLGQAATSASGEGGLSASDWSAALWALAFLDPEGGVPRDWVLRAAPEVLGKLPQMDGPETYAALWALAALGVRLRPLETLTLVRHDLSMG
jgi:hypothetical protein